MRLATKALPPRPPRQALFAWKTPPFALVSAVRETSMVFAVLFGVFFLKERLDLAKLASIGATLIGTAMLKISK
ncbi:EamA family transporter [Rhizobium lusitanum]|uniref:EamA family transporter n=1 Tax=Rhizobium lusitanum TaxID=293958 RepID=UPI003916F395